MCPSKYAIRNNFRYVFVFLRYGMYLIMDVRWYCTGTVALQYCTIVQSDLKKNASQILNPQSPGRTCRKLFVLGWVGGDTIDPLNILHRSCICPSALSVCSPDFTNFSPCVVCVSCVICPNILDRSCICPFALSVRSPDSVARYLSVTSPYGMFLIAPAPTRTRTKRVLYCRVM